MPSYDFQPDQQKRLRNTLNRGAGQLSPGASQALQILSLRLPDVLSGRPIAPDALLRPRVGSGRPAAAVAQSNVAPRLAPSPAVPASSALVPPMSPPPSAPSGASPEGSQLSALIDQALSPAPPPRFAAFGTGGTGSPMTLPDAGSADFSGLLDGLLRSLQ